MIKDGHTMTQTEKAMLEKVIKQVRNLDPAQLEELWDILKQWQSGKQRMYPRLDAQSSVDVVVGNRVIQTTSKNMSASGIFIDTSGKFEVDNEVRIVFNVPGYDKPFKMRGVIVRVESGGMAVKFEDITPYFKQILDDAIWEGSDRDKKS